MSKIPAAVAASVSAVVLAAGFAPAAFAAPAVPVQAPLTDPTAAPDPHASMPGMDPNMPGMEQTAPAMDPNMPGMDPNMPGMSHDAAPGMDPDMPGMTHAGSTGSESARPQAAVVGTFVVFNGGVLLTAGLIRRRAKLTTGKPSRASRPVK